ARADAHRRHQRGVGADEHPLADLGAEFLEPVIVAGDGARADVAAGADRAVAEICQVVGLDAGAEPRVLHLDEIAEMDAIAQFRAGAQAGEGTDAGAIADGRADEMAEGGDLDGLADRDTWPKDDKRPDDA